MSKPELTAEEVAAYLENEPGFFAGRESLLASMRLPHPSGQAVSLLEKQNDILRKEVNGLRERLHHLIATARDNDHLFMRLRALVLDLLDADSWPGVLAALELGLTTQFDVDQVKVLALDERLVPAEQVPGAHIVRSGAEADLENADSALHRTLLQQGRSWCGPAEEGPAAVLFGQEEASALGSMALSPLVLKSGVLGVLALGAEDAEYFRSSMDTLFLTHVAEVTSRLSRYWLAPEA